GDQFEKQDRVISTRGNRLGCELGAFSGQKDGLLFDYAFNVKTKFITLHITDKFDYMGRGFSFFDPIQKIILLLDGDKLEFTLRAGTKDYSGQTECEKHGCMKQLSETATGRITLDQLKTIANAKTIQAKIIGKKREAVLDEAYKIDVNFAPNTQKFLDAIKDNI
ncbi:MAG: hypothetical protein LBE89_08510, partial [Helicobacteraceae bacterium]|nr:hypothetical protein [Helicobacteraceae bacterium]